MKFMKKTYFLFVALIYIVSSCSLDKYPEVDFSDATFWKSAKDLQSASNRLYSQLGGFSHDRRSDELVGKAANSISAGNQSVPIRSSAWYGPYECIYTANKILDFAPRVTELTEKELNVWLAEAYFFRAYNYFELITKYGDVPLILKSFDDPRDPVIYSPRSPREDVIQQCYEDLEFAAKWLPTNAKLAKSKWGNVTRSSALGMIVRIGLYEGTFGKYHKLDNNYKAHLKKSIDAAEALKKEGHNLYPNFQELFTFKGEGKDNKENLLVKVYGPNGAGTTTHSNSRQMQNSVSLTRQMVDLFLYEDGLPRKKSEHAILKETSFNDIFTKRDPRLEMTIFKAKEIAYEDKEYIPLQNNPGFGYPLKKGFMQEEWATNNKETVDKMLIRYAEVLLAYAEALYEHNDKITDAQLDETVNKVRKRAGFEAKLTNDFVTTNGLDMLEEIRRERTVEFIDEGLRYDDIIRWKTAEKVLPVDLIGAKFVDDEAPGTQRDNIAHRLTDAEGKIKGRQVYDDVDMYVIEMADTRQFNPERDYLYPIPKQEIIRSNYAVTQNPKWD